MGTSTSSFGVGRRESHDSTDFYARFAPPEISTDDVIGDPGELDVIHVGDARDMSAVPDASVALVVTSPPYFAGKQYETALGEGHVPADYIEYLTMLRDVLTEWVRTLTPGGRIAVNVANLGRRPYRNLAADVTTILQDDLRLLLRGEVVWQKQRGASGSCAWGSYQSPANPVLRDTSERVIIASKGRFDRVGPPAGPRHDPRRRVHGGDARHLGDPGRERHAGRPSRTVPGRPGRALPAPADLRGRHRARPVHGIGHDRRRRGQHRPSLHRVRHRRRLRPPGPRARRVVAADGAARAADAQGAGEGAARRRRLHRASVETGEGVARGHGQLRGRRARRRRRLFELGGVHTPARPGLSRIEAIWRTIAKASIARQIDPATDVVVLTSGNVRGGPLAVAAADGGRFVW